MVPRLGLTDGFLSKLRGYFEAACMVSEVLLENDDIYLGTIKTSLQGQNST